MYVLVYIIYIIFLIYICVRIYLNICIIIYIISIYIFNPWHSKWWNPDANMKKRKQSALPITTAVAFWQLMHLAHDVDLPKYMNYHEAIDGMVITGTESYLSFWLQTYTWLIFFLQDLRTLCFRSHFWQFFYVSMPKVEKIWSSSQKRLFRLSFPV